MTTTEAKRLKEQEAEQACKRQSDEAFAYNAQKRGDTARNPITVIQVLVP